MSAVVVQAAPSLQQVGLVVELGRRRVEAVGRPTEAIRLAEALAARAEIAETGREREVAYDLHAGARADFGRSGVWADGWAPDELVQRRGGSWAGVPNAHPGLVGLRVRRLQVYLEPRVARELAQHLERAGRVAGGAYGLVERVSERLTVAA